VRMLDAGRTRTDFGLNFRGIPGKLKREQIENWFLCVVVFCVYSARDMHIVGFGRIHSVRTSEGNYLGLKL
jgi:hypothetical protein